MEKFEKTDDVMMNINSLKSFRNDTDRSSRSLSKDKN